MDFETDNGKKQVSVCACRRTHDMPRTSQPKDFSHGCSNCRRKVNYIRLGESRAQQRVYTGYRDVVSYKMHSHFTNANFHF